MMRRLSLIFVLLLVVQASPAPAADEVDSVTLQSGRFADQVVAITGELVGDYGNRRDGWTWAQLNDDSYAVAPVLEGGALTGSNRGIALRIPHPLAERLDPPGGYERRGPVVTATGVWTYHDPDRGGESYLEVIALVVVDPGRPLEERHDIGTYIGGVVLLALAALLYPRRRRAN